MLSDRSVNQHRAISPRRGAALHWAVCVALMLGATASSRTALSQTDLIGGPPINYLTADVDDRVARLAKQLEAGGVELGFNNKNGYLESVLKELDIPVSSQVLVFSKTSLQLHCISPRRPRAIYFNDDTYVGWCQRGDVLEIASTDAQQGATFYTLKQSPADPPQLLRDKGACLSCHASSRTQAVPGYFVRSVFADPAGRPNLAEGSFTTDQTSPLKERWGGWYVTGTHGSMQHMGNVTVKESDDALDRTAGGNLSSLEGLVETEPYLSGHSDIVALMVLEHQTQMHNAIAAANYETRRALHQSFEMNEVLKREAGFISESAQRRIDASADRVLRHLLMCGEFLLEAEVAGTTLFAEEFQKRGPYDSKGRSLREFDLKRRMFRYPCSYLIYSEAFDGLPDEVRTRVLIELRDILQADEAQGGKAAEFAHLTPQDRQAILEILRETKPEFAQTFSME